MTSFTSPLYTQATYFAGKPHGRHSLRHRITRVVVVGARLVELSVDVNGASVMTAWTIPSLQIHWPPSPRLPPPSSAHSQAAHETYIGMSGTGGLSLTWLKSLANVLKNFYSLPLGRLDVEQRQPLDTAHHL